MKYKSKIFLFLAALSFLINQSCKLEKPATLTSADARIITLVTPNDTLFGLGLYALTSGHFYKVTAYPTESDTSFFELEPYNNSTYDYYYETPLNEMGDELPETGEYVFDIEFDDSEFITATDYLSDEFILPPVLSKCQYDTDINSIVVRWDEIVDNFSLMFKVYNQQRELLYSSSTIDKSTAIYTLGYDKNTWETEEAPLVGEQLILQVIMYSFEPLAGSPLDTQAAAILEKSITWGE